MPINEAKLQEFLGKAVGDMGAGPGGPIGGSLRL